MDLSVPQRKADSLRHWSQMVQETLLSVGLDGPFGIVVAGGAENGQFCWIEHVDATNIVFFNGKLHCDEVILEIQGQKVAGYTLQDLQEWLLLATNNNSPVLIKTVVAGSLTKDLREFLNTRFQKGSLDHDLQQTIRNNIYKRTVPCTTRLPRPGEVDGVDYKFLTLEEFSALEKSGSLLESGVFEGNYYGTPKPPKIPQNGESPFRRAGSMGNIVPGQHPSSEGKRRRNRSNIETNLTGNTVIDAHQKVALERKKSLERVHATTGHQSAMPSGSSDAQYLVDRGGPEPVRWVDQRRAKNLAKDDTNDMPYGWEKVDDPEYGTYYINHINKKTQYENPVAKSQQRNMGRNGLQDDQPDSPSSGLFSDKSSDRERAHHRKAAEPWPNGNRSPPAYGLQRYVFTRNPAELRGDFVTTRLIKSKKGLGFTIIGGDDSNEEFLQIKTIIPHGPAYDDGKLQRSDILVYINDQCVLGYSHQDIISLFQAITVGECVTLDVCRGYPLPFDPDDPNNEIITTVAVTLPSSESSTTNPAVFSDHVQGRPSRADWVDQGPSRSKSPYIMSKGRSVDDNSEDSALTFPGSSSSQPQGGARPELHMVGITRGPMGFGFTIADSIYGQKVKQILDRPRCKILQEGDILVDINGVNVKDLTHGEVVQVLKNCPLGAEAVMTVQRGGIPTRSRAKRPVGKSPVVGVDSRTSQWSEDIAAFQKQPYPGDDLSADGGVGGAVASVPDVVTSEGGGARQVRGDLPEQVRQSPAAQARQSPSKGRPSPAALEKKLSPVLSKKTEQLNIKDEPPQKSDAAEGGKSASRLVDEDAHYRGSVAQSLQGSGMRDLSSDQRYSVYAEDDDVSLPTDKIDTGANHQGNSRAPGYDYVDYAVPRHNFFPEFDDRSASSHGTPPRREFVSQMSFNEFDKRPNVTRAHSRSKTPGPDIMRSRAVPEGDLTYTHRPGQELRSKTPTHEMMSRLAKPISGTPDFIPASRYQTPSPSGRLVGSDSGHASMNAVSGYKEVSPVSSRLGGGGGGPMVSGGVSGSGHIYGNAPVGGVAAMRPVTPSLKQLNQQAVMKMSTSFENVEPVSGGANPKDGWMDSPGGSVDSRSPMRSNVEGQDFEMTVQLMRQESGFGFRIIGGTEEGSQVSVGHIVPGGAADVDGRLRPGDEITYIDNICVIGSSHHKVVQLMGQSSNIGHVTLRVRRRTQFGTDMSASSGLRSGNQYDVTLMRRDGEGFGFVIISSVARSGSVIGKLVEGSPADRCGKLHVGDQIIAVNHVNITHMLHEQIVSLIKESGYTVTLTISGPDDTSSMSSATQRSASVPPASLGFQTQSESDMSRQSEYSPYHSTNPSRIPPPNLYSMDPAVREVPFQQTRFNPQQSAPDLGQSDKFYSIELQRGSRGFGFSIRGGKEFNNMSLFILKIAEGGAAHVDGRLKVGDQIIEINGYNTNSMTHANAIDLIQSCNNSIRLLIKRSGKPLPGFSTSQLPGTSPYLHNGVTPQDPPRSNDLRNPPSHQSDLRIPSHQSDLRIPSHQSDLRIPSHQSSDRSYLYAQSQRYPASYR